MTRAHMTAGPPWASGDRMMTDPTLNPLALTPAQLAAALTWLRRIIGDDR